MTSDFRASQGFAMMPDTLNRPVFASDKVRFVGDIVAAVVAETRAQAIDAAEAVVVDYDPLPCRDRPAAEALAPDAPLLFPEHGSNICFGTQFPEATTPTRSSAPTAVGEVTMVSQRLAGVPMETNGIVAVPDRRRSHAAGSRTRRPTPLHGDVRAHARARARASCASCARGSAAASGRRRRRTSSTSSPAAAALKLGRPVKWIATRSEDMVSLVQGRDYVMTAKLGVDADGKIVGLDVSVVAARRCVPGTRRHPADAHPDDVRRACTRSRRCGSRP